MTIESSWFLDPTTLLEELQRGHRPRPRPPVIPGYEEFVEIRRGGQGAVYRAAQKSTKRRVAVKVLYEDAFSSEQRRRRFEREIELVAGLRHPNIVSVYDSGVTPDGRPYLVMEYVEGESLGQWIAECGVRTVECLRLFVRICDAVQHAHQRGVIHRDLKPSNILVVEKGTGNRKHETEPRTAPAFVPMSAEPKVLDFGLAKELADSSSTGHLQSAVRNLTVTGHFLGTLAYASPEQLRAGPAQVDLRADVYALGVILYEMITGAHPYAQDGSTSGLIRAIEQSEPTPPSLWSRSSGGAIASTILNDEVDTVVLKAMRKDPADRYQSVAALRDDIVRYLEGRPLDAKRDSRWYVVTKTLRRHRLPAAAAAVFLVLIIGFGVAMSVLYRRARAEADKANQIRIFLEDTLASVEPVEPGREVTVRETLDEAVNWVELALAAQPEVAASIRTTIGNSYRSLGEYQSAERQLELALATRRTLFGDLHPEVAQSLNALGLLARDLGDLAAAEDYFRRALAIRRSLLRDDHVDLAMSYMNLATLHRHRGEFRPAEHALRQALGIQRRRLGDEHPDTAMCQFRLGELFAASGDWEQSEYFHREALAVRRRALQNTHPDLSRSLKALADCLTAQGRHEEAARYRSSPEGNP